MFFPKKNPNATLAGSGPPRNSTALPEVDSNGQVIGSPDREIEDAVSFAVPSSQCALCLRRFSDGHGDVCAHCRRTWEWAIVHDICSRSAQLTVSLFRWGWDRRLLIEQWKIQAPTPPEPRHGLVDDSEDAPPPLIIKAAFPERELGFTGHEWVKKPVDGSLDWATYRGVFDYPNNQSANFFEADAPATSAHILRFMGWVGQGKNTRFSGNASRTSILDQKTDWINEWKGQAERKPTVGKRSAVPRDEGWEARTGMQQPNDQFDFGAPGHPCSICHSKEPHKHARRPGDTPQIDAENLKPLPEAIPIEPAWLHFHSEGDRVIDWWFDANGKHPVDYEHHGKYVRGSGVCVISIKEPQLISEVRVDGLISVSIVKGREVIGRLYEWLEEFDKYGVQLGDAFDFMKYSAAVPIGKLDSTLRGWVHSKKHHAIDPNIRMLRTLGRYKAILRASDYNSTEESYGESGDSSGVNAPISAHKTGKYYGGDAKHAENGSNTTGWAGYVDMRRIQYREPLFDKECEQVLDAGSAMYAVESVFVIASEPTDVSEARLERSLVRQPMCSKYSSLPKAYCSHCQNKEHLSDEPEEINEPVEEEPIQDEEPDVFESAETSEDTDEAPSNESNDDDEPEVEDEAITAIESMELNKPFESVNRPDALDKPPEKWDEGEDESEVEIKGSGFADIDAVQKWKRDAEGNLKPRKGRRTPWWYGFPQEPRTKEQWEKMKLPYRLPPPCWPNSTMIYPLAKRWSMIDGVEVSVADEKLIWKQVEELCRSEVPQGEIEKQFGLVSFFPWTVFPKLIWKEHWDARVGAPGNRLRLEHQLSTHGATYRVLVGGRIKHQTHEYGLSILNPDTAYKNRDYTYIETNPILRTTGAAAEKERKQLHANQEAIEEAQKYPHLIPITIHGIASEDVEKSLAGKMSSELLIKYPGATPADWKQARHQFRELSKKNGNPRARWKRALRAAKISADEPGIFALTHFPRTKERICKIADIDDSDEAIWDKFDGRVMDLVKTKIGKNGGRLTLTGDADVFRQRAIERQYDPLTDKDLAIHELYFGYAQEFVTRLEWRGRPCSDQAPAGHAWEIIFQKLVVLMYQSGFGVYLASIDAPADNPLMSANWAEPS